MFGEDWRSLGGGASASRSYGDEGLGEHSMAVASTLPDPLLEPQVGRLTRPDVASDKTHTSLGDTAHLFLCICP